MAKVIEISMQNVRFSDCRLLGVEMKNANEFLFEVSFEKCNLELVSLAGMKLKETTFTECNLREANFIGSDLTSSIFANCDLEKALFQNTNLEKANLQTSYNYYIDPENNRIQKAKFSLE